MPRCGCRTSCCGLLLTAPLTRRPKHRPALQLGSTALLHFLRSRQSYGVVKAFAKTLERDYARRAILADTETVMRLPLACAVDYSCSSERTFRYVVDVKRDCCAGCGTARCPPRSNASCARPLAAGPPRGVRLLTQVRPRADAPHRFYPSPRLDEGFAQQLLRGRQLGSGSGKAPLPSWPREKLGCGTASPKRLCVRA